MTDARGDRPSRRSVLAGGGLLLVAACTGDGSSPVPAPRLSADQRLARRVVTEITLLATLYSATVAAHPGTRQALSRLAAEHEAHVAALVELLPVPAATPSGSPTPGQSPTPPPVVPASPAEALTALAVAERAAAARRRGQAGRAGPELARLLASIAACESVHATVVTP